MHYGLSRVFQNAVIPTKSLSQCLVLNLHLLIRPYTLSLNLNSLTNTSSAPIPEITTVVIGPITSANGGNVLSCECIGWLIELDY